MTKHMSSCREKHLPTGKGRRERDVLHLVAEVAYAPAYWLHLHASCDAMLLELDALLRDVWCECCGHLSEFRTPGRTGTHYVSHQVPDVCGWFSDVDSHNETMEVTLGGVLPPGSTLLYTYDFGSSTELTVRSIAMFRAPMKQGKLQIVARNDPQEFQCVSCGAVATEICTECAWSDQGGFFCRKCLDQHECGDEMALPIVNSPRMGVCGYTGQH